MNKDNQSPDMGMLSEQFKALAGNMELMIQLLDSLTVPIEIFAPDGMCIFYNRAAMKLNGVADANDIVGDYNLKNDPVCLEILGQECIDRIFLGEVVYIPDFPAPYKEAIDRGAIAEKKYEAATMDIDCLPIWDGDTFVCTVTLYTVKYMYHGRIETLKAQDYIEEHWRDVLNLEEVAHYVSMSSRHLRRVFIEDTGITPVEFYQRIKIAKIKEKLFDGNLSIKQAFDACGVDYRGKTYRDLFKEKEKMTPAEYRKKHNIQ